MLRTVTGALKHLFFNVIISFPPQCPIFGLQNLSNSSWYVNLYDLCLCLFLLSLSFFIHYPLQSMKSFIFSLFQKEVYFLVRLAWTRDFPSFPFPFLFLLRRLPSSSIKKIGVIKLKINGGNEEEEGD